MLAVCNPFVTLPGYSCIIAEVYDRQILNSAGRGHCKIRGRVVRTGVLENYAEPLNRLTVSSSGQAYCFWL